METRKLTMVADSFYIPKTNPSKPRGEDAHFISPDSQFIGVADGVGSWAKQGIDAGDYARELMANVDASSKTSPRTNRSTRSKFLHKAFLETEALGSSTACVISLDGNLLRATNLGDSGFVVIRDGKKVFRSTAQQYSFNNPYQMGKTRGGVERAKEVAVAVERGDVVVLATDGLFDNVFDGEIVSTVRMCLERGFKPNVAACMLANKACRQAVDKESTSPFEVAAREAGFKHLGGKYDDITVVVAYVVSTPPPSICRSISI